jgi:simple sugar transport system permease protein
LKVSRKYIPAAGQLPKLFGWLSPQLQANAGIIIALLATAFAWWLLSRSSLGFRMQVVGANSDAARTAGINNKTMIVVALCIAGAFVGLAGTHSGDGCRLSHAELLRRHDWLRRHHGGPPRTQ